MEIETFVNTMAADIYAEQQREEEQERKRIQEGRAALAASFAADHAVAARCARIVAALASEHQVLWSARHVVKHWKERGDTSLDERQAGSDLAMMFGAGLLDVEGANNGDEDGPATEYWPEYGILKGEVDSIMMLGAERWLDRQVEQAKVPAEPPADPRMARRHDRTGLALRKLVEQAVTELIEAEIACSCVYQEPTDEAVREAAQHRILDAEVAIRHLAEAIGDYVSYGQDPMDALKRRAETLASVHGVGVRMTEAIMKARARLAAELGEAP